ncbi:hypothetical protein [Cupriavidus sp. BIC8F]|uniref:FAD binding domain-containing protein n=1 Tax=Cupriavidus sp. BIC8F TaxID=3079014 RepID=UPI0029163351|nr:hypothetical protein [Cupriavidus sp. BIC8F]
MAGPALDALLQDRAGNRHSYSLPPGAMQDIEIRALKVAALNQLTPALAGLVTMTPNPFLQLKVVAHSGGMLAGAQAQMMSAEWRDFIRPHEERITALRGQKFSEAYQEGTQFNYDVKLDSGPPTAAMLAAESLAGARTALKAPGSSRRPASAGPRCDDQRTHSGSRNRGAHRIVFPKVHVAAFNRRDVREHFPKCRHQWAAVHLRGRSGDHNRQVKGDRRLRDRKAITAQNLGVLRTRSERKACSSTRINAQSAGSSSPGDDAEGR